MYYNHRMCIIVLPSVRSKMQKKYHNKQFDQVFVAYNQYLVLFFYLTSHVTSFKLILL